MDQRFIDLETKLAFQEDLVDKLNEVVTEQQRAIDRLESRLNGLLVQLDKAGVLNLGDPSQFQPPPHY